MRMRNPRGTRVMVFVVGVSCGAMFAQEPMPKAEELKDAFPAQKSYSPHAGRNFPTHVYWGDTHLHTGASFDAGAFGARLGPADAYRFARGEELTASNGMRVKLSRPLDFLVVADHSDNMGFFPKLFAGDPAYLADPTGKRWYDMIQQGGDEAVKLAIEAIDRFSKGTFPPALLSAPGTANFRSAWETTLEAAETYNDPGRFTAFIGYEWTSNTGGNNLHRVVVFRDGADKAGQVEPYTTIKPVGSDDPKDLWKVLQAYEDKTGGDVLAIAHNGNLSNGIMFPEIDSFTGKPLTQAVRRDARALGAALRGDADQGRRRGASVPLAERRVRRLRDLGQVQPEHERAEGEGHAPVRVRPHRAPDRAPARGEARRQPVQVRHDRLDRQPHRARDRRRGQLLRQALGHRAERQARRARRRLLRRQLHPGLAAGRLRLRRGLGAREHAAKRSSTPWSARRPTRPPARA